jgi:hypothetical protein
VVIGDGADATALDVDGDSARPVLDVDGRAVRPALAVDDVDDELSWASAGSCPVTSCTRIPPVAATNVPAATPATRRRIVRTRRRRVASRSVGVGAEGVGATANTVPGAIRSPVTVV